MDQELQGIPSPFEIASLKRIGVDPTNLGCLMIDASIPDVSNILPASWELYFNNPKVGHVSGFQKAGHVTLLHGFIHPAYRIKEAIAEVLKDWTPPDMVQTATYEVFTNEIDGVRYSCVVALLHDKEFYEANARLCLLPHIHTQLRYRPHVTLAYVKPEKAQDAVAAIKDKYPVMGFGIGSLNYGH